MNTNKRFLSFCFLFLKLTLLFAGVPQGYYNSVNGLKKDALKTALYKIISQADMLSYGSGPGKTWSGFYQTDRMENNQVRDRYSNEIFYFSASDNAQDASAPSGMNIEHSFPKSWWGGSKIQPYYDLFNLMPCEQSINSSKSNYAMGVVSSIRVNNGCTKVGTGSTSSGKTAFLWEPADKWKGDFARNYFYMVTAYENQIWSSNGLDMLENTSWPTLQKWAYELLLKWNREDPVDQIEIERNDAVYQIQGNRNPYIDFPNLAEYVWGDSVMYSFYVDGSGSSEDVPTSLTTIYSIDFRSTQGEWQANDILVPNALDQIWKQNSQYGMIATAYLDGVKYEAESWLISPEIDLTDFQAATLSFSHTGRFFGEMKNEATLWITNDNGSSWRQLPINNYMGGATWTFVTNETSLDNYIGQKMRLAFRYLSSTSAAATWEISSLRIKGLKKKQTSISLINKTKLVDGMYRLNGTRISSSSLPTHGIYLIVEDGIVRKQLIP